MNSTIGSVDREAAKAAMAEATAIREKEAAAFAKETAESKAYIAAIEKAVAALEKGMGSSSSLDGAPPAAQQFMGKNEYGIENAETVSLFLQTSAAGVLRRLAESNHISGPQRDLLTSFLSMGQGGESGYAPQSGEIVGMLKQMKDTMLKDLAEIIAAEQEAIKVYEELMAAKQKE